jgi:mono/diheme cytochrome c family protein
MKWTLLSIVAAAVAMGSCMDQYNPRPYWKQFSSERQVTSRKQIQLTDKGDIAPIEVAVADADPVSAKYNSLCSSCHGADGKADGAAAAAMNPKPRNFHDKAWQASVNDERIASAIKNGGVAVGLSGTMPAWGALLTDDEVTGLVTKIRNWGL